MPVDLSGVPETLLGNLGRRAAAARIEALNDPTAIELVDRLDYDFAGFDRGARWHALRLGWLDGLDPADAILVTAQGLFPYFTRDEVHGLIAAVAERLPGSVLVFDVVAKAMFDLARRGSGRERDLAVKLWTWLFTGAERDAISAIPGVRELRDLAPPLPRDLTSLGIAAIRCLPRRLRYSLPVFPVLEARFSA